jgi:hypothetical protein
VYFVSSEKYKFFTLKYDKNISFQILTYLLLPFLIVFSSALTQIDFREIGWDGMDLIDLGQDRDQWRAVVNTVMNFRVP